jgi:hypothetical protein
MGRALLLLPLPTPWLTFGQMLLMKKALIAAALLPILFIACKPSKQYCWQCDYAYHADTLADLTGDTVLCDFTETDIELRQDIKLSAKDKKPYTSWTLSDCKKK